MDPNCLVTNIDMKFENRSKLLGDQPQLEN